MFTCSVNDQRFVTALGTLQICAEKAVVTFLDDERHDDATSFTVACDFGHISFENEHWIIYISACLNVLRTRSVF